MSVPLKAKEITLPSGIFAKIERVSFLNKLRANAQAHDYVKANAEVPFFAAYVASIIAETTLFDGERFTISQVLDLDGRDGEALAELLASYTTGPIR
jgi:hypothetical protein